MKIIQIELCRPLTNSMLKLTEEDLAEDLLTDDPNNIEIYLKKKYPTWIVMNMSWET